MPVKFETITVMSIFAWSASVAGGSKHGRGAEQVSLRLPDGLRDRIKSAADANGRSMNAEIVQVLEERFPEVGLLSVNLGEVMQLAETYRTAAKLDVDSVPINDKFLKLLWTILSADDPEVEPKVRRAIRAKARELGIPVGGAGS